MPPRKIRKGALVTIDHSKDFSHLLMTQRDIEEELIERFGRGPWTAETNQDAYNIIAIGEDWDKFYVLAERLKILGKRAYTKNRTLLQKKTKKEREGKEQ